MVLLDMISILWNVILPIFLIIGAGVALDRFFKLDMETMSKLNFYVFVPAIVFVLVVDADLPPESMGSVAIFTTVHFFIVFIAGYAIFSIPRLGGSRTILSLAGSFYNAGNFGLPFIAFAFGHSFNSVLAVVLTVQNLLMFSFALWFVQRDTVHVKTILVGLLKIPVVWAVIAGLLVRSLAIPVIPQVKQPLDYIADGVIPLALVTLGAKLSRTTLGKIPAKTWIATVVRLIVSPLVAVFVVILLDIPADIAMVLVVSMGFPVAVNVYIVAAEYKNDDDVASQAIFLSTLLSAVTLSFLLAILTA